MYILYVYFGYQYFFQFLDIYVYIIFYLCYGVDDQEKDLYVFDNKLKVVEKIVNKM